MLQGVLAVVAAATLMGIMPSMQKQLLADGLPMFSLMFLTGVVNVSVVFLVGKLRGLSFKAKKAQVVQSLVMGLFGMVITAVLLNSAYPLMPVGTVTMIHFLYPTVVCIVMGTVFRAGFSRLQLAAILVSIVGMYFLAGQNGSLSALGILLAALSSLTYAGYLIANEKGSANELELEVKLFYASLPGLVVMGILAPITHNFALPTSPTSWFQLIVCSGLFTVTGYFLMMFGISRLGASTASFLSMVEPVVSVVFGTIWFSDPVTVGIVAGSILIMSSVLLVTLDSAQKEEKVRG